MYTTIYSGCIWGKLNINSELLTSEHRDLTESSIDFVKTLYIIYTFARIVYLFQIFLLFWSIEEIEYEYNIMIVNKSDIISRQ